MCTETGFHVYKNRALRVHEQGLYVYIFRVLCVQKQGLCKLSGSRIHHFFYIMCTKTGSLVFYVYVSRVRELTEEHSALC